MFLWVMTSSTPFDSGLKWVPGENRTIHISPSTLQDSRSQQFEDFLMEDVGFVYSESSVESSTKKLPINLCKL